MWESTVVRCAVEERYFFSAEKTVNGRSSIQQRSGCHNDFASAAATKAISLIEIGRPGSIECNEIFRQLSVIASNCASGRRSDRNIVYDSEHREATAWATARTRIEIIIRGCSGLLLVVGAAVFLVGGKFFYEIKHVNFLVSETVGILGGVLLMLLGAGMARAGKSDDLGNHFD